MTIPSAPRRKKTYDEDLLVQLVAEGRMSYRKIAEQLGISPNTVSTAARGVYRPDLYRRICAAVEDACRQSRRLAVSYLRPTVAAHIKNGLEGTGESARKSREFVIKMALGTSDPAGRYIGQPGGRGGHAPALTRGELDLLAAVRGEPDAPGYDDLPKRIRRRLGAMVGAGADGCEAASGAGAGRGAQRRPLAASQSPESTQPPDEENDDDTRDDWLEEHDVEQYQPVHTRYGTQKPRPPKTPLQNARAHWRAARTHDDDGRHAEAVAEFTAAIDLKPDDPELHLARSRAHDLLGDHPKALADLDTAVSLSPTDPTAWSRRAEFHYAHGRYDDAVADYNQAAGRQPECPYTYFHRARAFVGRADFQIAIDDLTRAMALVHNHAGYEHAALLLHAVRGRMGTDGTEDLAEFLHTHLVSRGTWLLPVIRMCIGKMTIDECLAACGNEDEKINDHHLCNANFHVGQHYLIEGDPKKAKEHFEKAVSLGAARAENCSRHAAAVATAEVYEDVERARVLRTAGMSEYYAAVTELDIMARAEELRKKRKTWYRPDA